MVSGPSLYCTGVACTVLLHFVDVMTKEGGRGVVVVGVFDLA